MNSDLKARWISALRSGDYEQATDALRTEDNKFCCFGVLADLYDPSQWNSITRTWGNPGNNVSSRTLGSVSHSLFGIPNRERIRLEGMNDGVGTDEGEYFEPHTFDQIADYIERNL